MTCTGVFNSPSDCPVSFRHRFFHLGFVQCLHLPHLKEVDSTRTADILTLACQPLSTVSYRDMYVQNRHVWCKVERPGT